MQKPNLNQTTLQISAGFVHQFPRDAIPHVAFSGRSNVGKSSLINCLLNRKSLARVSATPGKTITINFYNLDKKLFFVDLPGYGFAKRNFENKKSWSSVTDAYFTKNPSIDLLRCVVQIVDSKVGPTNDDTMMIQFLLDQNIPFIVVLSKIDKLNKTELSLMQEYLKNEYFKDIEVPIIPFSSTKNIGRKELWDAIYGYL